MRVPSVYRRNPEWPGRGGVLPSDRTYYQGTPPPVIRMALAPDQSGAEDDRTPGVREPMTEQAKIRRRTLLAAVMALAGLLQFGCLGRTATPRDAATGDSSKARAADRVVTLPSGATLNVAADWIVTTSRDGLTLEDPDKRLKIDLVEVEVDAERGLDAAISTALARRRPAFNRRELAASDRPGREGWDLGRWARYEVSPAEARLVSAGAVRKGRLAVVILVDGCQLARGTGSR